MAVHGVHAVQEAEKVFRPDGDHQRQADSGAETVASAYPFPRFEHVCVGIETEFRYSCPVGRNRDEVLGDDFLGLGRFRVGRHRPAAQRGEQPAAGRPGVGHRLLGRKLLAYDNEQRFGRVEIAGGLGQVRPVHVGNESHGQVAIAIGLQRLVGHQRPQVRAADAKVDHVADGLAGVAFPLSAAQAGRKRGHLVKHRQDTRHHVAAVHQHGMAGAVAKRGVQDRAVLGDVDLFAGEHPLDGVLQPRAFGQGHQLLHRFRGHAVLRVVQQQSAILNCHRGRTVGILAEKVPQMDAGLPPVMFFKLPPLRSFGKPVHAGLLVSEK